MRKNILNTKFIFFAILALFLSAVLVWLAIFRLTPQSFFDIIQMDKEELYQINVYAQHTVPDEELGERLAVWYMRLQPGDPGFDDITAMLEGAQFRPDLSALPQLSQFPYYKLGLEDPQIPPECISMSLWTDNGDVRAHLTLGSDAAYLNSDHRVDTFNLTYSDFCCYPTDTTLMQRLYSYVQENGAYSG